MEVILISIFEMAEIAQHRGGAELPKASMQNLL